MRVTWPRGDEHDVAFARRRAAALVVDVADEALGEVEVGLVALQDPLADRPAARRCDTGSRCWCR